MKAVFILLDSLNRRCLSLYNHSSEVQTPNIDRLAQRSRVFDQHWCGSAPCMPARRDILTGRLNFLERPWGGIEPFDHVLPTLLKTKNVFTHMETDHIHYAECGGENYWTAFTSWRLHRGAESDKCNWMPDTTGIPPVVRPENYPGAWSPSYMATRKAYGGVEARYSTPRTLTAAADWLERNHEADNFLLWAEGFDPHEPFDVPDEYLAMYDDVQYDGEMDPYWPAYIIKDYPPKVAERFRTRYKALLTMTDHYVGRVLEVLDRYDMWEDTLVILTTDHGYLLGEHGYWAKNNIPDYNEVYHLPMLIAAPGVQPGRCTALTQNIDLFPTILEYFGIGLDLCRNPIHGRSLWPLLRGEADTVRDTVLYGTYGKSVCLGDGHRVYIREPADPKVNAPLYLYGSTMTMLHQHIGYDTMSPEEINSIEVSHLPWTNYPVYKIAADKIHWMNLSLRFDRVNQYAGKSRLYDLEQDYAQEHPICDAVLEELYMEKIRQAMTAHDSPEEQFQRLGL